MRRYTVVFLSDPDEPGFTVLVPKLPGCVSEGASLEEALVNVRDAIEGHLEAMAVIGEEVPEETCPAVIATVEIQPDLKPAAAQVQAT